jgi:hypothetical protein
MWTAEAHPMLVVLQNNTLILHVYHMYMSL